MERNPSVAGMFYPGNPARLKEILDTYFGESEGAGNALGIVSPHAGYVYSGRVAAKAFQALPPGFEGTIIVIGPSHSGYSTCVSAVPWRTPLGTVDVDTEFIAYLDVNVDEFSHRDEHSLEVQIPFIQYHCPGAKIVPIMMGAQSLESAVRLAELISSAIESTKNDVRIVASSDFSHYVPMEVAERQDRYAIEALYTLDIDEFYKRIMEEGVSACGYGPIAAMVTICRNLGAHKGSLLEYTTSAETTGDRTQVVGYAAIAVM